MPESHLCSTSELTQLIEIDAVRILDCSWYLPSQKVDVADEFAQKHISSAQFFDIDAICDPASELPHMLPSADDFATAVSALGVSNQDRVVVYDSLGLFSAARVWWMFKAFGHEQVQVLNGGLPTWILAGGELSKSPKLAKPGEFCATLNTALLTDKKELLENCSTKEKIILDARSSERFMGRAPEPRPGLPSGHMPNSISLPFNRLLDNGKLKSVAKLHRIFTEIGINESNQLITSCGSGVTAAIITLALAESGYGLKRLYDGAWAEWGSASDTTILNRSLAN